MTLPKLNVALISGSGHCGSTLLDFMLDSHSKITGVGEVMHFYSAQYGKKVPCACGKERPACDFWSTVKAPELGQDQTLYAYRKPLDFVMNRNRFWTREENGKYRIPLAQEAYLEQNENLYHAIHASAKPAVLVDSSKNVDRLNLLARSSAFQLTVIHVVRDGRGVVWSYMKKGTPFTRALARWVVANLKVMWISRRENVRIMRVRYEDLVHAPEATLKMILKRWELGWEPGMLDFRAHEHHQMGGNRMRLKKNEKSTLREDLSWKQNLTFWQKMMFGGLAGWLNLIYKYGYGLKR